MALIKFEQVCKSYDKSHMVINQLDLSIQKGEFVTLIGPSGCGKTTLLKLINGLIKPDSGQLYISNKSINEWDPIELKRNMGYVIQQVGLFPHLTVSDNISFVLSLIKTPKNQKDQRAKELIKLVGLDEVFLHRYPRELSGGQKQRVGVARALASDPEIILMDEPLGAVDEIARRSLQDELLTIYHKLKKTIVFVTHDIGEALKLGSRTLLINNGSIEQVGTKEELIFSPVNPFVKEFMGLKGFTSYLNIATLRDVFSSINEKKKQLYFTKREPLLNLEAPIIEGIKVMFDHGIHQVGVKNTSGDVVGEFSLSQVFKPLNKN